jgi:phosphotransferase system IIB component
VAKPLIQLRGVKELRRKLRQMERKNARAAVRKSIRAGAVLMRRAVRDATPVDEGVLRRIQDYKIVGKGNRRTAVIGANVEKLKQAMSEDPSRPSNIDHLVEEGHTAPDGTVVPPSGHMRRAAREAMPKAQAKMEAVLAAEIAKGAK